MVLVLGSTVNSKTNMQTILVHFKHTEMPFIHDTRNDTQFDTSYLTISVKEKQTRSSATAETARCGGHYAVQGHSRSLILVGLPIEIQ